LAWPPVEPAIVFLAQAVIVRLAGLDLLPQLKNIFIPQPMFIAKWLFPWRSSC
jgi:hypothetical protein